ncbi:MAG: acyl-CoA dehydrogenase family protein, partial [Myxococcales bacterium]|nr:acyl-CoA dehydrogenase family protein [Myxococcales bacterium]
MDFEHYTDEHRLFREQARKFITSEIRPHAVEWEEAGGFPDALFRRMGELGYFGILAPEKYGGSGLDLLYAAAWIEEMSAHCGAGGIAAGIDMHGLIVIPYLARGASEEMKERLLVPAIKGEKIGALGLTEPGTGSDLASIQTTAKRDGDGYLLKGAKMFIT